MTDGSQKMKTACCGHKFEYLINSPIRHRGDFAYECVNCGHMYNEEDIKIITEEIIEPIPGSET